MQVAFRVFSAILAIKNLKIKKNSAKDFGKNFKITCKVIGYLCYLLFALEIGSSGNQTVRIQVILLLTTYTYHALRNDKSGELNPMYVSFSLIQKGLAAED